MSSIRRTTIKSIGIINNTKTMSDETVPTVEEVTEEVVTPAEEVAEVAAE